LDVDTFQRELSYEGEYNEEDYALSCKWYDIALEMLSKYNVLCEKRNKIVKDVSDTATYIQSLKVPFCYEYTKLVFQQMFNDLQMEMDEISQQMDSFPTEVNQNRQIVSERGCHKLSDAAAEYLENIVGYYADRLQSVREDYDKFRNRGLDAIAMSQQVDKGCNGEY
jgi:hypothetical protein